MKLVVLTICVSSVFGAPKLSKQKCAKGPTNPGDARFSDRKCSPGVDSGCYLIENYQANTRQELLDRYGSPGQPGPPGPGSRRGPGSQQRHRGSIDRPDPTIPQIINYHCDANTECCARGPTGPPGSQGASGLPGKDGGCTETNEYFPGTYGGPGFPGQPGLAGSRGYCGKNDVMGLEGEGILGPVGYPGPPGYHGMPGAEPMCVTPTPGTEPYEYLTTHGIPDDGYLLSTTETVVVDEGTTIGIDPFVPDVLATFSAGTVSCLNELDSTSTVPRTNCYLYRDIISSRRDKSGRTYSADYPVGYLCDPEVECCARGGVGPPGDDGFPGFPGKSAVCTNYGKFPATRGSPGSAGIAYFGPKGSCGQNDPMGLQGIGQPGPKGRPGRQGHTGRPGELANCHGKHQQHHGWSIGTCRFFARDIQEGEQMLVDCEGCSTDERWGKVWGDYEYTRDSKICRAAAYEGRTGLLTVEGLGNQTSFVGETRNGVTSYDMGAQSGGFVFVPRWQESK